SKTEIRARGEIETDKRMIELVLMYHQGPENNLVVRLLITRYIEDMLERVLKK
ncbi:hypothetical protein HAX54_040083, partial [Datura stramonium]|nr:hypothetical protein [Datura stramonium]